MIERLTFQPGESLTTTLSVDYHQYYLFDESVDNNLARGTEVLDGVIGPQQHVVQVTTGVPCGTITLVLHAFAPTDERADDVISAEADIEVASGPLWVTACGEKGIFVDWTPPTRLRVRVVVHDRDAATTFSAQEIHEIWIWPTDAPEARWRSRAIDAIGRSLEVETAHLAAG